MPKLKKDLGIAAIIASFIFLFNPNLNMIDPLPDFIGYIILCAALSFFGDLNAEIADARRFFSRALALDIAKIASIFIVFSSPSDDEQNTLILLVCFVSAVLELVFLIPAYRALFSGIMNLGYKYDNTSVLGKKERKVPSNKPLSQQKIIRDGMKKNYTEKMRSLCIAFVIFKAAMYTLPEFTVLSSHTYNESSHMVYIYDFVGLLRMLSIFACFIFGVIWLVRMAAYFTRIRRDEAFMGALVRVYDTNVLPRTGLFVRNIVRLVFLLIFIAALLCVDFRIDYFNVIPDTLAALLLMAAAIVAKKRISGFSKYFSAFAAYFVLSLVALLVEYHFFGEFFYSAIMRNDAAYSAYCTMLVCSVLDAAGFLLAAIGIYCMMIPVIGGYTGFSVPGASVNVEDKIKKVHSSLKKKTYIFIACAVLCAASDLFYDFGAISYTFAGIVNTLCTLIFAFSVYYVTGAIFEEVESKYMLE